MKPYKIVGDGDRVFIQIERVLTMAELNSLINDLTQEYQEMEGYYHEQKRR